MSRMNLFNDLLVNQDPQTFKPLVDPREFAMAFQEKLRAQEQRQPIGVQQPASPQAPAGAHAPIASRIDDQRKRKQELVEGLSRVPRNLGRWSALAGALQGIAANKVGERENARLDELYKQYEAQQQAAEAAQAEKERQAKIDAAVAAEQKRIQGMEDWRDKERWKRENPMPMTPQDQAQMAATQAQIAKLMQDMELSNRSAERDAVEDEREDAAIQEEASAAEAKRQDILGLIENIYSNTDGLDAYSGYSGSVPTVRPEQKAFEAELKRLQSGLTIDNLQAFKGAMSEKEMATAAAAGQSVTEGATMEHNQAELVRLYESMGGDPSKLKGGSGPREVTTQEEYDALPSGAEYIEDGKRYRKP